MEALSIAGVAAITVICWLAAEIAKAAGLAHKWLPVVCGVLGAALGPAAMAMMPEFPAGDMLSAVAVGIVSGLAATGGDQIFKQLSN